MSDAMDQSPDEERAARSVLSLEEPGIQAMREEARENAANPRVECTPNDALFAQDNGMVIEAATPRTFKGAVLGDRFVISDYIQSGQFGRGWRARDRVHPSNPEVFVKTIRSHSDRLDRGAAVRRDAHERQARKEVEVFLEQGIDRLGQHPNIVTTALCFGAVEVPNTRAKGSMFFFLSPDLCNGGELFEYLCFQSKEPPYVRNFSENIARRIFSQLVAGVQHMHHNNLFHRDLKLENLVLDSRFVLKITDFGSAKWAHECPTITDSSGQQHVVARTVAGTLAFHPPELRRTGGFYKPDAFDVWCCGVILFYLIAMETMVARRINFNLFHLIKQHAPRYKGLLSARPRDDQDVPLNNGFWSMFHEVEESISLELKQLLNSILDVNVPKRASIDEVASHPWLQGEMPTDEEYFEDMKSRPTTATNRNRILPLPADLAESSHEEIIGAVRDHLAKTLDVVMQEDDDKSIFFENTVFLLCQPTLFSVELVDEGLKCTWLLGTLEDWLGFVFEFRANLLGPV